MDLHASHPACLTGLHNSPTFFFQPFYRYARWSLGFVDPPLEVSGRENRCTVKALNERGTVILPAVIQAMESLKADGILKSVEIQTCSGDNADECGTEGTAIRVDVVVVPPADVGSFSEEDRSRQVSTRRPSNLFEMIVVVSLTGRSHILPTPLYRTLPTRPSAFTIFSGPIADRYVRIRGWGWPTWFVRRLRV
jgi:hypothetical protein